MDGSYHQSRDKQVLTRVFQLLRPEVFLFLGGMLFLLGAVAINLIIPEFIRNLLNQNNHAALVNATWQTAVTLVAFFAVQGICAYGRSYLFSIVGQNVVARLRRTLFESMLRREVSFFDQSRSSDLVSRLSSDALLVQDAVSVKLSVLIRYSLQVIAGIILMLTLSARLSLILVTILAILVGASIVLGRKLKALSKLLQAEVGGAAILSEEALTNVRVVKAFGQEHSESERYSDKVATILSIGARRARLSAFFASFVSFLMYAALVLVILYGASRVSTEALTFGDFTAFLLYGVIVGTSFAFLASAYAEFLQGMGGAQRIFEIVDQPPDSIEADTGAQILNGKIGTMQFERVGFSYPARPEVGVLQSVSFSIPAGQTTALVGPSGSGKSTIANLALRFYDPREGRISVNGIDVKTLSSRAIRSRMAYVPQEPAIFGVSIAENLKYGRPDASVSELERVSKEMNLLDLIRSLPQGFDTLCGERGIQLSGGERQRLALARAMLREPELLILDEATSALDSANEALVQEALHRILAGRTCLVIAHRLSTIKHADQVLVLDSGSIVQQGTHDTLSATHGLYQEFVLKQGLGKAAS